MNYSDFTKKLFSSLSVGLEIGNSSIKAVWFRPLAGGVEIVESSIVDLGEEAGGMREALAKIARSQRASFPRAAAVFTRKGIYEGASLLPPMPVKELAGFLKMTLVEKGGLNLDDPLINFFISPVKPSVKKQAAITRIVESELWQRLLGEFNRSRLSLRAVNYTGLAFESILPETERDILLVKIGSDKSIFYLFQDRKLAYVRRQDRLGGDNLTRGMTMELVTPSGKLNLSRKKAEEIKASIGIPDRKQYRETVSGITLDEIWPLMRPWTDKLINSIRDSIAQYSRNFAPGSVGRVYLTGGGAMMPGLCRHLDENISQKVELLPIPPDITFASKEVGKKFRSHHSRLLLALGSGRCRRGQKNLLGLKNRILSKLILPFRLLWIILPLAAITFFALGLIDTSRKNILRAKDVRVTRQLASLRNISEQLSEIKKTKTRLEQARGLITASLRYPRLWPGILWEISEAAPDNLVLGQMEMNHRHNRGIIFLAGRIEERKNGTEKNPEETLNLFIRRLLNAPFFEKVAERQLERDSAGGDFQFSFDLYLQRGS